VTLALDILPELFQHFGIDFILNRLPLAMDKTLLQGVFPLPELLVMQVVIEVGLLGVG